MLIVKFSPILKIDGGGFILIVKFNPILKIDGEEAQHIRWGNLYP